VRDQCKTAEQYKAGWGVGCLAGVGGGGGGGGGGGRRRHWWWAKVPLGEDFGDHILMAGLRAQKMTWWRLKLSLVKRKTTMRKDASTHT